MSLSAISLPAEHLYTLTDLGQNRLSHPRLPPLDALPSHRYIALHAAGLPPDFALLEEKARWLGWSLTPGLTKPPTSVAVLRPESERSRAVAHRTGHNLRAVDLATLPRGAIIAVAEIIAERAIPDQHWSRHPDTTWYLGPITILPAPVAVDTEGWPCGVPWDVLPPVLDVVRAMWSATRQVTPRRRSA